jgi:hypothetical protein
MRYTLTIEQAQSDTDDVLERYDQLYISAVPLERASYVRTPTVFGSSQLVALLNEMRKCVGRVMDLQWYIFVLGSDPSALQMCKWCESTLGKIVERQRYAQRMYQEALMLAEFRRMKRNDNGV